MNVADVYDYKNFQNHRIQGAEHTNTFISKPKEKYIESLFEELVTKTGFNSFKDWTIEFLVFFSFNVYKNFKRRRYPCGLIKLKTK